MPPNNAAILTINAGSSSIRFAIYNTNTRPKRLVAGKLDRIGLPGTSLQVNGESVKLKAPAGKHRRAVNFLVDWLAAEPHFAFVVAAGHRIVHGMKHSEPELVTPRLLEELRRITPFDPDHLPLEIELIEAFGKRYPKLPQVVCFDTAFHSKMPPVARLLPLPRRYAAKGLTRYGFHGLSDGYLMEELGRLDPEAVTGRVILAHLGSGASLAAVRDGKSIDTSMGFTPTSGLVMSTRTGDLDPAVIYYFSRTEGMSAARFQQMVNHESGLLGISGTSSDMRDLLLREANDERAAEAVALFCYQAKKWIGAYAAALGGLDTLIFSGGIGENAAAVRERICDGLDFLGIKLSRTQNARNASVISTKTSTVRVRVIPTDEELMIARSVLRCHAVRVDPPQRRAVEPVRSSSAD